MNNFDKIFFQKFIADGVVIKHIIHKHFIVIADKIILNYFLFVGIPTFLYYYSDRFKEIIPFFVFEIYLFGMFLKITYDIFNWYNDVWIVTEDGVTELDWSLLSTNAVSVKYSSIEGLELVQDGIIDTIFGKGDLVIHKIGGENFILKNATNAYNAIDIIDKFSKEKNQDLDDIPKENLNQTLVDALSEVVKDYIQNNGVSKKDLEESKQIIEQSKKIPGTIDLSK